MSDYSTIITDVGRQKIAAAYAGGASLKLKYFAVGDGGGGSVVPVPQDTELKGENFRTQIADLKQDETNPSWLRAQGHIPQEQGQFWIRECGLFDEVGDLIVVAAYPETYKPAPAADSGVVRDMLIEFILEVSNVDSVELIVDPSAVLATREYVDSRPVKVSFDVDAGQTAWEVKPVDDGLSVLWNATSDNKYKQDGPAFRIHYVGGENGYWSYQGAIDGAAGEPITWAELMRFTGAGVTLGGLTEKLASENYVDQKVADLVGGAPETMDTLKELSQALSNNPDFASSFGNHYTKEEADEKFALPDDASNSITSNGSVTFQNGLILKWGKFLGGVHGTRVYLPVSFPNECFTISATAYTDNQTVAVNGVNQSSFYVQQLDAHTNANSSGAFDWFAIGF